MFGFFFALVAAGAGTLLGETLPFATLYDSVIGACVGAGAIAIIGWLGELALKKEAMGFGDVTLMAMVGAFLGPGRTLLTIFIGAFLGAVGFPRGGLSHRVGALPEAPEFPSSRRSFRSGFFLHPPQWLPFCGGAE